MKGRNTEKIDTQLRKAAVAKNKPCATPKATNGIVMRPKKPATTNKQSCCDTQKGHDDKQKQGMALKAVAIKTRIAWLAPKGRVHKTESTRSLKRPR